MKILLVLVFLLSATAQAQCFVEGQLTTKSGLSNLVSNETTLLPTTDTLDTCTGHWISSASDIRNAQAVEVTPEGFLQSFTFGLTLYLTFWYGPYLVSLARQLINKL